MTSTLLGMDGEVLAGALVTCLFGVICFLLGVAYAIYRALDWVDRMRAWAHTGQETSTVEEVSL